MITLDRCVSRVFKKIIKKYRLHNVIADLNRNQIIEQCRENSLADESIFYEQAKICNVQNDRSKIRIGHNSHIMGELHIFGYGGSIHIGNDCFVGPGSRIWSGENITIGNSVFISHNVNVVDTNSHETNHIERHDAFIKFIKDGYPKDKGSIATKPIVIEDHAWISFGATILKGVPDERRQRENDAGQITFESD